jgi:hypothetical protein
MMAKMALLLDRSAAMAVRTPDLVDVHAGIYAGGLQACVGEGPEWPRGFPTGTRPGRIDPRIGWTSGPVVYWKHARFSPW